MNNDSDGSPYSTAREAAAYLTETLGAASFTSAVVLGSGWGETVEALGFEIHTVGLDDVPGFEQYTVPGHKSEVSRVIVGDGSVLVFAGRRHLYEGASVDSVVHAVRTAHFAGCGSILLTNAAGSINPEWPIGTPIAISDHLNLMGSSPMVGNAPPSDLPGRFCDMSTAYSQRIRRHAADIGIAEHGIYAGVVGGNYETPAEIGMLRTLGANLVGMSTVLEVIAARHLGMEVGAISLVTNFAAGVGGAHLDHADVLAQGEAAKPRLAEILGELMPLL